MPVNYTKINWVDRVVQRPRTYTETANQDSSVTHTPAPGTVLQAGTPRSAANMDHMDQGIKDCADAINDMESTLQGNQGTLANLNTRIGNNERAISDIQRVNEQQSTNIAAVTSAHNDLAEDEEALETRADSHIARRDNPHNVTKTQLGLDKVQNVSTNDQTPTYTEASSDQNLTSGEKMSTAFGKISRAIKALWQHIARTDNPHEVTAAQLGAIAPVSGTYTGNGASTRTIDLGFYPKVVIYCDETSCFSDDVKGTRGGVLVRGTPQYCWDVGYSSTSRTDSDKIAEIVSNGFKVYDNGSNGHTGRQPNKSNVRYVYIAW